MKNPKLTKHHSFTDLLRKRKFSEFYMVMALAVLTGTTILWSTLSARIHLSNSDQLVSPYLFESSETFQNAVFPGQHSFLLKWPVFVLMKHFGFSALTFTVFTVALALITVLTFAYILYRIDKRPLAFGTICLALASTLLMIPAQPYPGGLLPVGLGMITTRNIEYIFFIVSVLLIVRSHPLRGRRFWAGVSILGVLIASDKLFLSLGLAGSAMGLVMYMSIKSRYYLKAYFRLIVGAITASVVAYYLLFMISRMGITNIQNSSGISPYAFTNSLYDFARAIVSAMFGSLTNLGANPAYSTVKMGDVVHDSIRNLASVAGVPILVNLCIFGLGLYAVYSVVRPTLQHKKEHENTATLLTTTLALVTICSLVVFIGTKHYYVVDSRYLAIIFFTFFVGLATYISKRKYSLRFIYSVGLICAVSIMCGVFVVRSTTLTAQKALSTIDNRNNAVANVLRQHQVNVLLGDYWRVLPIKQLTGSQVNVYPLEVCTKGREVLTSANWKRDIKNQSFVYLLSLDKSLTDYPRCTFAEVTAFFGRPSSITLIAGTNDKPDELLLFYSSGTEEALKPIDRPAPSIEPISLDKILNTTCTGTTIVTVIAHQDDDLLFMNPDLDKDIKAGHCIRTIYVTSGDSGGGQAYWIGRELGSQASYAGMLGVKNVWNQKTVKLSDHQYISYATPKNNKKVSLVYMRLPDGGLGGRGFAVTRRESLEQLEAGRVAVAQTVDGQSTFSSSEFASALTKLIGQFRPTEVRTLSDSGAKGMSDHSDHRAVSRYVTRAVALMLSPPPLVHYIGYTGRLRPENVSGAELGLKMDYFLLYASYDKAVCQSYEQCNQGTAYGHYLKQQYTSPQ